MSQRRILGIVLLVAGAALLVVGVNASQSFADSMSNTFTGTWVVRSGWLQGAGDGTADGYNSLGTNVANRYVIDPLWPVPNNFASGSIFFNGPAILDMGASLANCAG